MTSRFDVVTAPALQPGHCWITKTGVGPFIDTKIDLSLDRVDRGRIYISVDAVREMAQAAGLFGEKEPVTVELKRKQWYDQGYNDAIKEMSNDAVNRFIEHTVRNSVGVAGNTAMVESASNFASAGAAIPNPADTTAGTSKDSENVDGLKRESSSTGSVKRPVSISTNSSDESEYRL